jgi:DNA-binding transcriptional LysR family regulator
LNVQALRYFLAVVDTGHFGRAAERMHVTQPSISQAVQRLEASFGGALLDRSGGTVVLTDLGAQVVEDVRAGLAHLDRALVAARPRPEVRITCTAFFAMWVTTNLLTPYRVAHPDAEVTVAQLDVPDQVRALRSGEADVAAGEPLPEHPDLEQTVIDRDRVVLWLAEHHPLAAHDQISLGQLTGVVVADGDPHLHPIYHRWIRDVFANAGVTPRFAPSTQDSPSAISRIMDGSTVSLAADIRPPGTLPGLVVRAVREVVYWEWTVTIRRSAPSRDAADLVRWLTEHRPSIP